METCIESMRRIQEEPTAKDGVIQSREISRGKVAAKAFHTGLKDKNLLKNLFMEYSCFTMVCYFLLYSKGNQLYVNIYLLFFEFPSPQRIE